MRTTPLSRFLMAALLMISLALTALPLPQARAQEPAAPAAEPPPPPAEPTGLPDGYIPPPALSGLSVEDLSTLQFPNQTQGSVQLTVLASPARFTAPHDLTYTFIYTNTQGTTATGIQLQATFTKWVKAATTNVDPNKLWQYCADNLCTPTTLAGPNVSVLGDLKSGNTLIGITYGIADLGPSQSGRFSVTMRVPNKVYPVDGAEPRRPSGSGRLFLNNDTSTPISEQNGTALSVAPVFVVTKTIIGASSKIYPLNDADFKIRVENADREDAVTATNITLIDYVPLGSEFVGMLSGPQPNLVTIGNKAALVWNLPGPLAKGQGTELSLRFRKLDGVECSIINNRRGEVTVSSPEMPLIAGSTTDRYTTIAKADARYTVQAPLVVHSISPSPNGIPFGDVTQVTIKVRNYWTQPITDGRLTYTVQPNAQYRPGTASDSPISAPDGLGSGGDIVWRLDMPAGSITAPSEKSFTIGLRGMFTTVGNNQGLASLSQLNGVPSGCVVNKIGGVSLKPRLLITKYTDVEKVDGRYYSQIGDTFYYVISLTNTGPDPIEDVAVVDLLPDEADADFSYAEDATLDDVPFAPDNYLNGFRGRIEWRGITVEPGATRELRFGLIVGGTEFRDYCNELNRAEIIDITGEDVITAGKVCTRINPNFRLSKEFVNTADSDLNQQDIPPGGREVKFRLRITNNDSSTFKLGLYDFLPSVFSFVRVESSTANNPPILNERGHLEWDVQDVPVGGSIEAVIVTNFNPPCEKRTYVNEIGFVFRNNQGEEAIYRSSPATVIKVNYICGTNRITYAQKVDRTTASLGDRVIYTLSVTNKNIVDAIQNVTVVDILPLGFSFVGMANGAGLPQQITRPDGRIQLTWTIARIDANKTENVQFVARTGSTVSSDERNRFYASAPELLEATCSGKCESANEDGRDVLLTYTSLEVRPLITYTPQILAGNQTEECGEAGSLRNYRLTLINTNNTAYTSTEVQATLPIGLHYLRAIGETPAPQVVSQSNGTTQLIWRDLVIPKKPNDLVAAEYLLEVELEIGQVWGDLPTSVAVTSADGIIPLTDGEIDPQVKICLPLGPAIAKDSSLRQLRTSGATPNQEFLYQIEVVNPGSNELTLTIEDQLPPNVTFLAMVAGPSPTIVGSTLTWSDLQVPASAGDDAPGLARMLFQVRFASGEPGAVFENVANVVTSSEPVDQTLARIGVQILKQEFIYLPVVLR
ncbi:MAG: DUF11 domain-containing protein [Oscillochloris sp.]|nr:DUF11 domain-containing protein [Oscillochloris sp.]